MNELAKYILITAFLMVLTITRASAEMISLSFIFDKTQSNEMVIPDGKDVYMAVWKKLDLFKNYNGCVIQVSTIGQSSFPSIEEIRLEESNPYFTSRKVRHEQVVVFRNKLALAIAKAYEKQNDETVSQIFRGLTHVWGQAPKGCDKYESWVFSDLIESSELGTWDKTYKANPRRLKEEAEALQERFLKDQPMTSKVDGLNLILLNSGTNELLVASARFYREWLCSLGSTVKIQSSLN